MTLHFASHSARTLVALALLTVPTFAQQLLRCEPYHANGIYALGETVGWRVSLAPDAKDAPAKYDYAIKTNNAATVRKGNFDLANGVASIEASLIEPAMLYVEITPTDASIKAKPIHLGAAIAPTEIKAPVARPADFDAFWDAKLAALAKVPINAQLTPTAPPADVKGVDFYTVKLDSLGSNVHGYLAKPAREGKFPAIVLYQWAGVYALIPGIAAKRAEEGWLVLNVSSHDLPPTAATGVPADYAKIGAAERETSYFLNMYLRDHRAIDYIASRPEWDGKTLVVMGTSMGGHQSLVSAALDARVTAVLVNEPSGANSRGEMHGYQPGYPTWDASDARAMRTGPYFDTINFAPRIKAPLLAAIGFIDTICPPAGIWMAVNQVPGAKEVIGMVESDHNNLTPEKQGDWERRSKEVLELLRKGETFRPNAR